MSAIHEMTDDELREALYLKNLRLGDRAKLALWPEMVEALEGLLAVSWPTFDKQSRTDRAMGKARAVLAKVRELEKGRK